jgi:hypothetical protein
MRWAGVLWLAIWVPVYWKFWGPANFLYFCDVAVVLTCLGWWRGSSLLLSSQAVGAIVVNLLWTLDVAWRWVLGRHLLGGTEYMFDAAFSLPLRMLSLFHVVWPALLLWSLARVGYDSRGLWLQCVISVPIMIGSRIVGSMLNPPKNLNFALTDPLFHRQWGSAAEHLALTLAVFIAVIYLPTHLAMRKWLPSASKTTADSART